MSSPLEEVRRLGQSIWYDNIRRSLITSGEMERLIERGVSGVTSNPTIFEKAISGSTDYDGALLALEGDGGPVDTYEALAVEDIRATADLLRPHYDATRGGDGYASLEVSPTLAHDTDGTVTEAKRLFATVGRPNLMVKVPATPEGIPAIRQLVGAGMNLNVTLIFSLDAYARVREAYVQGLEDLAETGEDPGSVASVASFFVSRVDTAVDALLEELLRQGREEVASLLGTAAISNSKLAYQAFKHTFSEERFQTLRQKGARVQRPLWASTGTKNPAYSDVVYIESLIGSDTVNTVPPATLTAFMEHGNPEATLEVGVAEAERAVEALAEAGVNMEEVTDKLLTDGVKSFADSFEKLLANIEDKVNALRDQRHAHRGVSLGAAISEVERAVSELQQKDVVARIWAKDHTVWKPEPKEITNRLGWLSVSELMFEQVSALEGFADEVRNKGTRHVVLLGMGGSSLGPEVLKQTIGSAPGYPELVVLDSTVPARVGEVTDAIDPASTLFVLSSKSGGTIEPLSFYAHFRSLVEGAEGPGMAGQSFVAITDPGTSLEDMARREGFLRSFLNPSDVGGRYSVLSYFGLVPAALMGIDLAKLLDRAEGMREGSASCVPAHENPGAWLGAIMGTHAPKGRDKLTIVTSPAIDSFGLWVEQLIAESTGKESKGIIPVAGEPLAEADRYGDDRLFVYLRLDGDDNSRTDGALERLRAYGQPLVTIDMRDAYDLGSEFYRWEFATAVAGSMLGIHAFDQPNVQAAKDMTDRVLKDYQTSGRAPQLGNQGSLEDLLAGAKPGEYLAITAYLRQTAELDQTLGELRRSLLDKHGITTTMGYGPRYLHSTGQLHKGGPNSGMFLQLVGDHERDLPIPGKDFTFGVLADSQALGDWEALQESGRRVARIRLGRDHGKSVADLVKSLR